MFPSPKLWNNLKYNIYYLNLCISLKALWQNQYCLSIKLRYCLCVILHNVWKKKKVLWTQPPKCNHFPCTLAHKNPTVKCISIKINTPWIVIFFVSMKIFSLVFMVLILSGILVCSLQHCYYPFPRTKYEILLTLCSV